MNTRYAIALIFLGAVSFVQMHAGCEPLLSELPAATFNNGGFFAVNSVAWQATGTNYYVAMGGDNISSGPEVRVLQFDPNAQTLTALPTATFDNSTSVNSVAWLSIGSSYYIAMGGNFIISGPEVRVLQFDPNAQILSELLSATFNYGLVAVNSVAWLTTGTNYYVAMGGNFLSSGPEMRVLQFDPNAQILMELPTAVFDNGVDVNSVAWLTTGTNYYVVMGGGTLSGPEVRVLQFDPNAQTLTELPSATFDNGVSVNSVAWLTIGSSYYVAMCGNNLTPGPEIRVLQFDPNAQMLSELPSATFDNGTTVNSVAWLSIGSSYYVAMGGDILFPGPEVRVLQFDPNAQILSELPSATFDVGTIVCNSVVWQAVGSSYYVAMGCSASSSVPEVRVLLFDPCLSAPTPAPTPTGPASPLAIALVNKYNSRV